MKKIFFGTNNDNRTPFWQPWGFWGFWGRFIGFLLLLLALIFLLSLFRSCEDWGRERQVIVTDPNWNLPIDGGEDIGLPAPGDNILPPFEETEPIINPGDGGMTEIYPNLLYVIFNSDANDDTFRTFAQGFTSRYAQPEHKIEYYNTSSKTCVLTVPSSTRDQICQRLPEEITGIEFMVIPVEVMTAMQSDTTQRIPDDPALSDPNKSWYFDPIQAKEAWEITMGSPEVIVGIVDSYMDLNHPELRGDRCIYPFSVVTGSTDIAPLPTSDRASAGHGTLVTAVAVGNANNGNGSSGIAPNCKYIPVSMGDHLNTITQVEGILYCIYHGATVVNISSGSNFPEHIINQPIEQQIQLAEQHGTEQEKMWDFVFKIAEERNVTIVWAAGNSHCFTAMDTSKRNANTIRVSAVNQNIRKADFSNFGNFPSRNIEECTISAPGVAIWNALPNNSYEAWDGTSFSAPIITGVVALMKSIKRDLTNEQIIDILKSTSVPVEGAPEIGNLVQIRAALEKVQQLASTSGAGAQPREER